MEIKGVIFDLDHTLFDRYATLAKIKDDFFSYFDVSDSVTADRVSELLIFADKNYVHFGWQKILSFLTENGVFKNPPTYEVYSSFLLSEFTKYAVKFDFTAPMLLELRRRGLKTGLITNGKSEIQRAKLALLELEPFFDEIIISGELGAHKPSAEPFLVMAQRLSLKPSELLYVGDNPENDIEASRRAGYIPVWVRTTGSWAFPNIEKPPLQIDDVSELISLLDNLK